MGLGVKIPVPLSEIIYSGEKNFRSARHPIIFSTASLNALHDIMERSAWHALQLIIKQKKRLKFVSRQTQAVFVSN